MEKHIRSEKEQLFWNYLYAVSQNPGMPKEQIKKEAADLLPESKKAVCRINIHRKLHELHNTDEDFARWVSEQMTDNLPDEMYQNLDEWFDDKPISDIKVSGHSINMALRYAKGSLILDFPCAVMAVIACVKDNGCSLKEEVLRAQYKCRAWKKSCDEYGGYNCFVSSDVANMLDGLPPKLFVNVEEWLMDKPFSEIVIGELSIKKLKDKTKAPSATCIELMNEYVNGGCNNAFYYLQYGKMQ